MILASTVISPDESMKARHVLMSWSVALRFMQILPTPLASMYSAVAASFKSSCPNSSRIKTTSEVRLATPSSPFAVARHERTKLEISPNTRGELEKRRLARRRIAEEMNPATLQSG